MVLTGAIRTLTKSIMSPSYHLRGFLACLAETMNLCLVAKRVISEANPLQVSSADVRFLLPSDERGHSSRLQRGGDEPSLKGDDRELRPGSISVRRQDELLHLPPPEHGQGQPRLRGAEASPIKPAEAAPRLRVIAAGSTGTAGGRFSPCLVPVSAPRPGRRYATTPRIDPALRHGSIIERDRWLLGRVGRLGQRPLLAGLLPDHPSPGRLARQLGG